MNDTVSTDVLGYYHIISYHINQSITRVNEQVTRRRARCTIIVLCDDVITPLDIDDDDGACGGDRDGSMAVTAILG